MKSLRTLLALAAAAAALQASAQSTPATNFTDMWWNPAESGWGISFAQHTATNQAFAVWYTYDPRAQDTTTAATTDFVPLWFAMPGGTWITPRTFTGNLYVTIGSPYRAQWNPGAHSAQPVGTFTFAFTDNDNGTFSYNVTPPAGLPNTDPRSGLPQFSGVKPITRQSF